MMSLFLQIWGGSCYLLNKILFSLAENQQKLLRKRLQLVGWVVYILGVPAWVIVLVSKDNWIAASIEAGGIPAMLLGLYNTYHDYLKPNRLFNAIVTVLTYTSLAFGVSVSLIHHHGLSSLSQVLEVGVMLGFLFGSYLMAKRNPKGWLFFMLMNVSMASLMLLQDKWILMVQQLVSLMFVIYGYRQSVRKLSVH
ncbi:nicotinamide mononucleotide transporter [Reinekea blandensis]|uniref:Uncharacterized protein n=1 Tax=Reinekea blandensis MED297 TaxID=314283 RepID=A4B9K1_9GAMM|nr:nicotinamide mononucleotide transporter [Reinekea blandensis]EAR11302.1 hypothetical protein MED297_20482 [Reinekea sp. MED297] [Reinekea blandensis MED297]